MTDGWAEKTLKGMQPRYAAWTIWIVHMFPNQIKWCAKPIGCATATINVDSPEELVTAIGTAETRLTDAIRKGMS
jgi:hypothetical protein